MGDFQLEKATYYYYNLLSEQEKTLYKQYLYVLLRCMERLELKGNYTKAQIEKVSGYIVNDRPDIFWYPGSCSLTSRNNRIQCIEPKYICTAAQKDKYIRDIENSTFYREVNAKMRAVKYDVDKALVLYEYIIKNTEYEKAAVGCGEDAYSYAFGMQGVLLKHRAVCAGYAKTFQYFASKHNMRCTYVAGQTRRARHAWNLIWLGGDCYYVDATWGDPTFTNAPKSSDYVSYDYFCFTTAELQKSHNAVLDEKMPLCTATRYNYYAYMGLLESQYSVSGVAQQILNAKRKGKSEMRIKYATQTAYQRAVGALFTKQEIFEALRIAQRYERSIHAERVRYSKDDDARTITVDL